MPNFEKPPIADVKSPEQLKQKPEIKFEVDDLKLTEDQIKEKFGLAADKKEIINKLIESGGGIEMAMKMHELNIDPREPAKLLIEKGFAIPLIGSIEASDKNAREAYKDIYIPDAIKRGEKPMSFDDYATKVLKGPYDSEIAKMLIEKKKGETVAKYLYQFEGADPQEIAGLLIKSGDTDALVRNIKNFENIDHNLVARKLIEVGKDIALLVYLDDFKGLDSDTLKGLLEKVGTNQIDREKIIKYAKKQGIDLE